jgi:integrase/recombinase XerD
MPFEPPRPKRLRSEIRVFTHAEMLRLRDLVWTENARDWAIFMLLLDTGMRTGELCQLHLTDVHWDREEVVIRPETAKNRRGRTIPLSGSLSALRKYRALRSDASDQCPNLFLGFYSTPVYSGGPRHDKRRSTRSLQLSRAPLTRVGLYQLVAKWGRLAGITEARCSPHTFRHFFATEYLRNGGNIVVLQRILGHSRLDVTERYLRVVAADLTHSQKHFSPANAFASRNPRHERLT